MSNDYQGSPPRLLLSIQEAQAALGGISRSKIWSLANSGEITRISIGTRRFITLNSIEQFIARQTAAAHGTAA
ncbi:helix-turn-helix domain-containing protein [Mycobacterium bourgelatii]|uniref:Helix-turn-helix domain-containing protein n=1 Tax=Mycobacterium bourgelatii TaxID=1273442 RepID=A0A7I9YP39_MYCBU|nr:helix-turn-helix domain-containing protein [Mycobacterium bourgelatii]MCV6975334.1 helix-turn-helix domain-containing protein [Mycobacterium bourgelatii]GFG90435.1 hypothetical protein MBOU_24770 [Mycobacterium bourgelatii]